MSKRRRNINQIIVARSRGGRRGFTLVELVVSIVAGTIISGLAAMLIMNASRQRGQAAARGELVDQGAAAMEVILRYAREISQGDDCPGNNPPCLNKKAQISTADASDLQFDAYGIRQSGNELQITSNSGGAWHRLAANVSTLTFTYHDRDNLTLAPLPLSAANREKVRRVTIQLSLAAGTESAYLRTSIYLRNFMNEVLDEP